MLGGSCSPCCGCGCNPTCTNGTTPTIKAIVSGIGSDAINGEYWLTQISSNPVMYGGDFKVTCAADTCATVSLRFQPCGTSAIASIAITTTKGSVSVAYETSTLGGGSYSSANCEIVPFYPSNRIAPTGFSRQLLNDNGLTCLYGDFGDSLSLGMGSERDCTKAGGQWHSGVFTPASSSLANMGACCEGTTCSVKPQCQCQGTGKVFKGVGTVCTTGTCGCCGGGESIAGKTVTVYVSTDSMPVARWCAGNWVDADNFPQLYVQCPDGQTYFGCRSTKACANPVAGYWVDTATTGVSATYSSSGTATTCNPGQQGSCPGLGTRSASVLVYGSPCKIYAFIECPSFIGVSDNYHGQYSTNPYYLWDYDANASEYNALYYVFQYATGTGLNTMTQSINSTPVAPTYSTGSDATWVLTKTVAVTMRITLA